MLNVGNLKVVVDQVEGLFEELEVEIAKIQGLWLITHKEQIYRILRLTKWLLRPDPERIEGVEKQVTDEKAKLGTANTPEDKSFIQLTIAHLWKTEESLREEKEKRLLEKTLRLQRGKKENIR